MRSRDEAARATISRAGPEHWQVYRDVRLAALSDTPQAFASTLERALALEPQDWQRLLSSPSAASFLAWLGGQAVGQATGKIDDPDDEFAVPGAWQLVGMWVRPAARGLGVADSLVEAVAAHARNHGAESLVLWVTEVNGRARAFYRRLGFVPTGARQLVRPEQPDHWEVQMIRRPACGLAG